MKSRELRGILLFISIMVLAVLSVFLTSFPASKASEIDLIFESYKGEKNGQVSAIPYGIPSSFISGIIAGDSLLQDNEYMEMIRDDEYLEITPKSLRLRKIILDEIERKRQSKREESAE